MHVGVLEMAMAVRIQTLWTGRDLRRTEMDDG